MISKAAFDYFDEQYKPELCKKMIAFCSSGKSPEAFAASEFLSPEIFAYWAKVHVEFEISLHIAFWRSFAFWEDQAINNPKMNSQIYKTVMQNRFKWKDGQEDLQRVVKAMSDEDLEALARRLLDSPKPSDTIDAEYYEEIDDDEF